MLQVSTAAAAQPIGQVAAEQSEDAADKAPAQRTSCPRHQVKSAVPGCDLPNS